MKMKRTKVIIFYTYILKFSVGSTFYDIRSAYDFFKEDLNAIAYTFILKGEFELWKIK